MNAIAHREFLLEHDVVVFQRRAIARLREEHLLSHLFDEAAVARIVERLQAMKPPYVVFIDTTWDRFQITLVVAVEHDCHHMVVVASDALYG